MKPTTTWVFVSPVRPQLCQSRMLQGTSGRAAGAHRPCLLAAQDGQTKSSLPGGFSSSLNLRWGCCFLLLLWLICDGLSSVALAEQKQDSTESQQVLPLTGRTPESDKITQALAATCREADDQQAPAMVVIKPGVFQMGSPPNETGRDNDEDLHQVTIPRPFAISRCEITVGQFRQFIKDTGYITSAEQKNDQNQALGCNVWNSTEKKAEQLSDRNWRNPGFAQNDQHPVVCVSWQDAQRFVDWLSQRTDTLYRLPTEAEWEFAARAGTQSPRYYQDDKQCDYANGLGQEGKTIANKSWTLAACEDAKLYTAPVASFAENHFGLFDMLGNVNEWTIDCEHSNYEKAPPDGSAWLEAGDGNCDRRVVRGGSWNYDPQSLRSAIRGRSDTDGASNNLGFRIARAL